MEEKTNIPQLLSELFIISNTLTLNETYVSFFLDLI